MHLEICVVHVPVLMVIFVCPHSGVWCVIQHGKSTLQSFPCWWAPSLDTWCSVSLLTGEIYSFVFLKYWGKINCLCLWLVVLASQRPSHRFEMYILRFGRHPVLIISVLFMLVFGLTVAFSVNVPMFSTLRFFEGFCLAGIILSLYVLSKSLCFLTLFNASSMLFIVFPGASTRFKNSSLPVFGA